MQPFSQITMDVPLVSTAEFCRRSGMKIDNLRKRISKGDPNIPVVKMGEGKSSTVMINIAKMTESALAREY